MLRLAFDFIITWRETRTRPNAYNQHISSQRFFQAFLNNISYRSMLKNTDIITNIKSNDILSYYFTFSL